jgi:beta-lactamase regulating signal transducer with metallopeptidase domain
MIGALINHLWQSTLFCAAVWLITLALRANGAALRHSLWLIASLKFLVPFSALYYVGAAVGWAAPVSPPLFSQAVELTAPVVSPTDSLIVLGRAPLSTWTTIFAAAWAIGAGVVAFRWWQGWRLADSMARAARLVPGSSPDTRVTDAGIEPAVARVFRPVVLLPAALLGRLSPAQLEAVVAHERQHIARHDNLWAHLQRCVETLFWFHPLVWWIGRQLVEERERACDEAVLERGHDAHDYAEGILAVCRHCHELTQLRTASSALSGDLTRRIRGIVCRAVPRSPGFCKTVALNVGALAMAVTPLFAGALDEAARRREQLLNDTRLFQSARIHVSVASGAARERSELRAEPSALLIRNTSLRELVALAYGVSAANVEGGGDWLDAPRYDIRAEIGDARISPEDFEPAALRPAVNELLASRFDLQVHVNQRCQAPCGRRALLTAHSP